MMTKADFSKSKKWIAAVALPAVLIALAFFFLRSKPAKEPPPALGIEVPIYSGILVQYVIPHDIELGKGRGAKLGSEFEAEFDAWIYDPKKFGNKGTWLTPNNSDDKKIQVLLDESDKMFPVHSYLEGMKPGAVRSLVVPDYLVPTLEYLGPVPKGAHIIIEYKR
jgi:hypothetical protein